MKKRLVAVFGIFMMLFAAAIPLAHAAPNTNRGYEIDNSGYDGLRAVVSTMTGNGSSPPPFSFATKSPDVFQQFQAQVHPKNSCVQVNVAAQRNVGSSITTHRLDITNWCSNYSGSGTFTFDLTNAAFRTDYVRTLSFNDTGTAFQDEVVDFRIILTYAPTNQWSFYLYNYTTSTYDFKAYIQGTCCGTPTGFVDIGDGGYTQDATMSCPTLYPWGIFQIRGIQKRVSGSWSLIGSGDITYNLTDSWPCLTTNNYQERRTIPYQFKIEPYGVSY